MYKSSKLTELPCTVNTRLSSVIHFQRIWWINMFARLNGYYLVLVHYILVLGKCDRLKGFEG